MYEYCGFKVLSYKKFNPIRSVDLRYKNKYRIASDYVCFDTETSHTKFDENNPLQCINWIYQWCFSYQGQLIYGRKPSQFIECFKKIAFQNEGMRTILYCHNLPYDWSYLQSILEVTFGKPNILAYDSHKVFVCTYENGLEFRCTYKLTNKSLIAWNKDTNIRHKKLVGAIDYDIIRYQDTPLVINDWKYMFRDVVAMVESMEVQLKMYDDTIATIPLTSTAYVRREILREYKKDTNNFKDFQKNQISPIAYQLLRKEGAGGLTHGNNKMINITIYGNIRHRDFVSHYPSQQKCRLFPITSFKPYFKFRNAEKLDIHKCFELAEKKCVLTRLLLKNVQVKDYITFPYIQESKCIKFKDEMPKIWTDNGRVVKINGVVEIVCTEYDLKWIFKQYNFDYLILEVYVAERGKLPDFLLNVVDEHFKNKTHYKNEVKRLVNEKADELSIFLANVELLKSKNVVNGIFGCTYTDIVRDEIINNGVEWVKENKHTLENICEVLDSYYNSRKHCMRFEWGCYTTSLARDELMQFIELIGYEHCLYCDTDSIFYLSSDKIEKKIARQNAKFRAMANEYGHYVTLDDGKKIYYHQFEDEKENIKKFRFLHAKCYAYETDDGQLHCTIAGVPERKGKHTRKAELGSIDNLNDGFTFTKCGGTRTIYYYSQPQKIEVEGHMIETCGGALIVPTTKTLSHNDYDINAILKMAFTNIESEGME